MDTSQNADFHLVPYRNPLKHGPIQMPVKVRLRVRQNCIVLALYMPNNVFFFQDGTTCRSTEDASAYVMRVFKLSGQCIQKANWSILIDVDGEEYWFALKHLHHSVFQTHNTGRAIMNHFTYHDFRQTSHIPTFLDDYPDHYLLFVDQFHPKEVKHHNIAIEESSLQSAKRQKVSIMEKRNDMFAVEELRKAMSEDEDADPEFELWNMFDSKFEEWSELKLTSIYYNKNEDMPRLVRIEKVIQQEFGNPRLKCTFMHPRTGEGITLVMSSFLMSSVPEYKTVVRDAIRK